MILLFLVTCFCLCLCFLGTGAVVQTQTSSFKSLAKKKKKNHLDQLSKCLKRYDSCFQPKKQKHDCCFHPKKQKQIDRKILCLQYFHDIFITNSKWWVVIDCYKRAKKVI